MGRLEAFSAVGTRKKPEAKKKGEKIHMARVHGLIYEKNYQLKEDDLARKLRFRRVSN